MYRCICSKKKLANCLVQIDVLSNKSSRQISRKTEMFPVVDYTNPQKTKNNNISCVIPEFEKFKLNGIDNKACNVHPQVNETDDYKRLYNYSLSHNHEFWSTLAISRLEWFKVYDKVFSGSFQECNIKWFLNGKLNVSVNCLDRHVRNNPDAIALIWEKNEPNQHENVTYAQLLKSVCRMANVLKSRGIKKGDRVAIYMPQSPIAVAAMLACARIGAVHTVVFAGFSSESLASRINDAQAVAVVTCNESIRGKKTIPLQDTVRNAIRNCSSVETVFVCKRVDKTVFIEGKEVDLDKAMALENETCEPEIMDSEDALFILYTSGSTGKPKGLVHTQAGYLLYAAVTQNMVFNYNKGEVFSCVADIGWITGHSYVVYGPLCNGATSVLFESTPTYPDPGRYWEMVERLKINQFYCAPTALRSLLRHPVQHTTKYSLSSLRTLGCVGEPLNCEAWEWYFKNIGNSKLPIADTWWQTETGGIVITPRPAKADSHIKVGKPGKSFFGIDAVLLDESGNELNNDSLQGALCIKTPWPGMCRTIWGDHERYKSVYFEKFKNYYFSGDGAIKDKDGDFEIIGRMDDVINISGHRLGTAEVEDVIDMHSSVSEAAVVGYPHKIKGEGIFAFVSLKEGIVQNDVILDELKKLVKRQIASFAVPDHILFSNNLPKTRSGKIMRRILKKIVRCQYSQLGDISTLAETSSVDEIVKLHQQYQSDMEAKI